MHHLGRTPRRVTGGWDDTVRIWDLTTGCSLLVYDLPSESHALATGASHLVVGIGRDLVTFDLKEDGDLR